MNKRWTRRVWVVILGVVVAAAAFEWLRSTLPRPRTPFTVKDLAGRPWSLEEHRGRGPLVLVFFATW